MTNIDDALDAAAVSNTDETVLGLDIGGTSIKMGIVTRGGKILATAKVPTGELDNAEAFDRVSTSAVALVREAGKDPETLGAIGIDVPGVVLEDGTLAMARSSNPNSAGSQFYFCLGAQPFLDDGYTVFGQTIEGKDVIGQLRVGDVIEKIEIENANE